MPRPFRFTCPEPGRDVLSRPRLVRLAGGRWDHRVVTVVAPAGFGKTTLLAQACEENALAPRGVDVWLTCQPPDADGASLATDLLDALGEPTRAVRTGPASCERIAAAVWRRAPEHVALVLDDVHDVPSGSTGAELLAGLVAELPANGHLVLASRVEPPVALRRVQGQGQVIRIDEQMLRLTPDELDALAVRRGSGHGLAARTGGWPALVELAFATADRPRDSNGVEPLEGYVWEEVLSRLEPDRRRTIAAVLAAGGGDDEVASAAADRPVRLAVLLDGVPLVDRRPGGSCSIHALWGDLLSGELSPEARQAALRRVAAVHHGRGQLGDAVELLAQAEDWAAARSVVVEACATKRVDAGDPVLERWRAILAAGGPGPELELLDGILHRKSDPGSDRARGLLDRAATAFQDRHDDLGEIACLAELTHMAWHRQDLDELRRLLDRTTRLARAGYEPAVRCARLGRVLLANASRDYEAALAAIEEVDRSALPPEWRTTFDTLGALGLLMLGRAEEALERAERAAAPGARGSPAAVVEELLIRWFAARPLEVLDRLPVPADATPTAYAGYVSSALAAIAYAWTGRCAEARAAIAALVDHLGSLEGIMPRAVETAVAAGLSVAEGDERSAAEGLRAFLAVHRLDEGPVEQALRRFLTLPYVLLPEVRELLDAQPYGPGWAEQRAVARALVDAREGRPADPPAVTPERVVTALPLPWAVELGEALARDGRALGHTVLEWLLEHLGPPARDAVRSRGGSRVARALLSTVPAPPELPLRVDVLGPAELWRGDVRVDLPAWRREKVRLLLVYLLLHGVATREEIAAALWPGLDGTRAGHNLRVNLNHLRVLLEPGRATGEAPWFVRHDGDRLRLHGGHHLTADVWAVDRLLDAAEQADRDGVPSLALAGVRDATALWRGEPLVDARYEDWAAGERDRLQRRLVRASVRAGELVLAAGDPDDAEAHARRALQAEPWSEGAYRVLMGSHLARGDRPAALRTMEQCRKMLEDLGVAPSRATTTAFRRVADAV